MPRRFDVTLPNLRWYRFRNGHELKVSTTIIWGRRDLLTPIWQMRRARRLLPQARFVVLPGCGHVPMSDDPEQLVAELMARVICCPETGDIMRKRSKPIAGGVLVDDRSAGGGRHNGDFDFRIERWRGRIQRGGDWKFRFEE